MNYQSFPHFMDEDFIQYLNNHYLFNIPHRYGQASERKQPTSRFYYADVRQDPVTNFVTYKLFKRFGVTTFKRIYMNLQFIGMDGDWHADDGESTYMLMVTPTLKQGSGIFEIKEKKQTHSVSFEQNKLVVFQAKAQHRGLAPLEPGLPRLTLVFKTT